MSKKSLLSNFTNNLNVAVIGASGGIGQAFIQHLYNQPQIDTVFAFSRSEMDFTHPKVQSHRIDLQDETSIKNAAAIAGEKNRLDVVIIASGILHEGESIQPEKSMRSLNPDTLTKIFSVNTIGPALVAKHFLPLLNHQRKSVFAAISARVGSIADNRLGGWYAYRSSKAALNMIIKNAAIETARSNKQAIIIGLHPGTVDTNLSKPFQANVAEGKLFKPEYSAERMLSVINALTTDASGKIWAWDGAEIPY